MWRGGLWDVSVIGRAHGMAQLAGDLAAGRNNLGELCGGVCWAEARG